MRQQCLHMHDLNYCFKFFKDRIKLCSMGKSTKKKDESFKLCMSNVNNRHPWTFFYTSNLICNLSTLNQLLVLEKVFQVCTI